MSLWHLLLPVAVGSVLLTGTLTAPESAAVAIPSGRPEVRLPYAVGNTWTVSCGYVCHQQDRYNLYAVDFLAKPSSDKTVYSPVTGKVLNVYKNAANKECRVDLDAGNNWTLTLMHLADATVSVGGKVFAGTTKVGVMGRETGVKCGDVQSSEPILHMALWHRDSDGDRSYRFGAISCYPDADFSDETTQNTRQFLNNCSPSGDTDHDFSGDGCEDIVGRRKGDGTLRMYAGNCQGGFGPQSQRNVDIGQSFGSWAPFDALLSTDLSGDGCVDVIGRHPNDATLRIYRGNCASGFSGSGKVLTTSGAVFTGWNGIDWLLAPGDMNRTDGKACNDIIGRVPADGTLRLWKGNCNGRLYSNVVIGTGGWNAFTWLVAPGDMTGDGCPDIVGRRSDGDLYRYDYNCDASTDGVWKKQNVKIWDDGWNTFNWVMGPGNWNSSSSACVDVIGRVNGDHATLANTLRLYTGNCSGTLNSGTQIGSGWGDFDFAMDGSPTLCPPTCPATPTPSPSPTASATATPTPVETSVSASAAPTGTTTETPIPTPSPTAVAGVTVTPTPAPNLKQGDINCDGAIDSDDALNEMLRVAELEVSQEPGCPAMGSSSILTALFGDVDCSGTINSMDAVQILRWVAGLALAQFDPCVGIGVEFVP